MNLLHQILRRNLILNTKNGFGFLTDYKRAAKAVVGQSNANVIDSDLVNKIKRLTGIDRLRNHFKVVLVGKFKMPHSHWNSLTNYFNK